MAVAPAPRVRPRAKLANRRRAMVAAAVVVAALGYLVWQGLGNATVFFKTADEAVAQRAQLGTRRFRLEGTVVSGSTHAIGKALAFTVTSKGVDVPVIHTGDEPPLFRTETVPPPVVLEGHFSGTTFLSDRILVKHTESYTAQHPDRVDGSANQP